MVNHYLLITINFKFGLGDGDDGARRPYSRPSHRWIDCCCRRRFFLPFVTTLLNHIELSCCRCTDKDGTHAW